MREVEQFFRQTIEDDRFSKSERRALKEVLEDKSLSTRQLGVLRSQIFKMAKAELKHNSKALAILGWLEDANKLLLPKTEPITTHEVHFSPGDDCLNAIRSYINRATTSLDICVFTISDNRITRTIQRAAQRGVKVRIISDNDKRYDKGSDIMDLGISGIPIRLDESEKHMHHKFAVIDSKFILTGSYNWTRQAATRNEENVLITDDPEIVLAYRKEFDKLWPEMTPYLE